MKCVEFTIMKLAFMTIGIATLKDKNKHCIMWNVERFYTIKMPFYVFKSPFLDVNLVDERSKSSEWRIECRKLS